MLWTDRQPRFRGVAAKRWVRAMRWCERRTQRDGRLAAARGRSISRRNLGRLELRRVNFWREQLLP